MKNCNFYTLISLIQISAISLILQEAPTKISCPMCLRYHVPAGTASLYLSSYWQLCCWLHLHFAVLLVIANLFAGL